MSLSHLLTDELGTYQLSFDYYYHINTVFVLFWLFYDRIVVVIVRILHVLDILCFVSFVHNIINVSFKHLYRPNVIVIPLPPLIIDIVSNTVCISLRISYHFRSRELYLFVVKVSFHSFDSIQSFVFRSVSLIRFDSIVRVSSRFTRSIWFDIRSVPSDDYWIIV